MNVLTDDVWAKLVPRIKTHCPRLTDLDLREAQNRIDLLVAKIQNRHWTSRVAAQRLVLATLQEQGSIRI